MLQCFICLWWKDMTDARFTVRPLCKECNKEIWGISKVFETMGTEKPTYLHSVCYERLKEIEWMFKDLDK